ncbi:MAG: FKBP-type peptidyl-prolyl cis-trans isomerase, partial [Bacteroidales bacterium]|nr:FKBP-type peptidyl-prolyl cis-trans isomerase [Bacteroidales bacterium]
ENTVKCHYEGRLVDGTIFDSSYERGEPTEFPLNRVIPGWTEGLQLMGEGAEFEFYIPSELGYGERAMSSIPANSVLIFKIELISVVK